MLKKLRDESKLVTRPKNVYTYAYTHILETGYNAYYKIYSLFYRNYIV